MVLKSVRLHATFAFGCLSLLEADVSVRVTLLWWVLESVYSSRAVADIRGSTECGLFKELSGVAAFSVFMAAAFRAMDVFHSRVSGLHESSLLISFEIPQLQPDLSSVLITDPIIAPPP